MRDWGSVLRGLKAMNHWYTVFGHWAIRFALSKKFWAQWWTPKWHDGEGPYITIGIGLIRIYRGY